MQAGAYQNATWVVGVAKAGEEDGHHLIAGTCIIDPDGILRAMVYYPMSNGRSIDEFLRLVKAMQTSDANGIATPENWQPGDKVIVPPPATTEEAAERAASDEYECTDWYFCKKSL